MDNEQPDTDAPSELVEASDVTIETVEAYIARTLSADEAGVKTKRSAQTIRRLLDEGKIRGKKVRHPTKGYEMWRVEKTGLFAEQQAEDPTAMVGAVLAAGDVGQLLRMWKEDRTRADELALEIARIREQLDAREAELRLLISPPTAEPPTPPQRPQPWWQFWRR